VDDVLAMDIFNAMCDIKRLDKLETPSVAVSGAIRFSRILLCFHLPSKGDTRQNLISRMSQVRVVQNIPELFMIPRQLLKI